MLDVKHGMGLHMVLPMELWSTADRWIAAVAGHVSEENRMSIQQQVENDPFVDDKPMKWRFSVAMFKVALIWAL